MKKIKISKKLSIQIFGIVLLLGLIILFSLWMSKPRQGRVTLVSPPFDQPPITRTDKILQGTYIRFSYSGKYAITNSQNEKNGDLEAHTLTADTPYQKRIVAIVSNLPDGRLTSYPAYSSRSLRPDDYVSRSVKAANHSVEVWVRRDGTEQTAFMQKGNKVATIAFVTANPSDQLTSEIDTLLGTFQWK